MRFTSLDKCENFVIQLCNELASRMKQAKVAFAENLSVNILMRQIDAPIQPPKFLGTGKCDAHSKSVAKMRRNDSVDVGQNLATYVLPGQSPPPHSFLPLAPPPPYPSPTPPLPLLYPSPSIAHFLDHVYSIPYAYY